MSDERFEVRVEVTFDAPPPGHTAEAGVVRWTVAAHARSTRLDRIALVVDFRRLRDELSELTRELADGTAVDRDSWSPPAAAGWLLGKLRERLGDDRYEICAVEAGCEEGIVFIAHLD